MPLMENLLNLYRVDSQVRALRSRLESAQRYRDAQQRQLNDLQKQQAELEQRRRHVQATAGNLEAEIKSIDERIEKFRGDLNAAATTKQYNAVLTEVNTAKEERAKTEERILQEMEQVETLEADLKQIAEQIEERHKVLEHAQKELEQRQADVGERLAELEDERKAVAATIPAGELQVFDELAETYDGEAMAEIEEINRRNREYACGACNMQMPFERVSMLLSSSEAIVRCSACHRILYLQEETRGSLVKR